MIWYKNKRVLEEELNYPKKTYQDMYEEFIVKEVKSICNPNKTIELFKDFDRKTDFFESVQKTMAFYIQYKLMKIKDT